MKYRTPKDQRTTYVYESRVGAIVTLHPNKDGVTEADIATLHDADDAECNNEAQQHRSGRKIVNTIESLNAIDPDLVWVRDNAPLPDEEAESADEARQLYEALATLPKKQANAVIAVWIKGMTAREYATQIGVKEPAVSRLIGRAFDALRGKIKR